MSHKSFWKHEYPLILASKSPIRKKLIQNAKIKYKIIPSDIDENDIKNNSNIESISDVLSEKKAEFISQKYIKNYVLGCDQIIIFENKLINKCDNFDEAFNLIKKFSSKQHKIISSYSIFYNGKKIITNSDTCNIYIRKLSDDYIKKYIDIAGDKILGSVGCYQYEGLGINIIEKIEGEYTTVLGLPMIKLLADLRNLSLIE